MTNPYTPPTFNASAFNCVFCGAYANQNWGRLQTSYLNGGIDKISNATSCFCRHCRKYSFWQDGACVYPLFGAAPLPNADMPEDVKLDYEEARSIVMLSPRGAAALLRLAIQKLCRHLGEKGENINTDIASLVKKGLPEPLQQALDSVRVVGNNAVHPGQIDFTDSASIANSLFGLLNIICENRITQPKMISQFYHTTVPEETRGHIDKRDGRA